MGVEGGISTSSVPRCIGGRHSGDRGDAEISIQCSAQQLISLP